MKAFIITLKNNETSSDAALRCMHSANIPIDTFKAFTPRDVPAKMMEENLEWTYPWNEAKHDFASGLYLTPYRTNKPAARIACFLSHYDLWKKCIQLDQPIMILEHDAIFIRNIEPEKLLDTKYDIIGINDPRGATRKSQLFHEKIQAGKKEIQRAPEIDEVSVPQGIAGNSAYIIKPSGAKKLLSLVNEFGAWPNDAIMCRQLIPTLGVTKTYYTKVQGTESTTRL